MLEENKIHQGDCMELMKHIPDKSVDMILCDLPYGITQCSWDLVLPLDELWKQYKRILKENGVVVLTASQPFTSKLVMSNLEMFRYEWIWDKVNKQTGFLDTKFKPLKQHENILVFYKNKPTFNIQWRNIKSYANRKTKNIQYEGYGKQKEYDYDTINETSLQGKGYPISILQVEGKFTTNYIEHPTQKPIKLFRYLIETYTNEGDLVLDNCIGIGTTAIACKQANRRFIGIELNQEYAEIANKKLKFTTMTDFYSYKTHNRNLTEDFAKSSQINPTD